MPSDDNKSDLLQTIRAAIIGDDCLVETPFGPKRITYADYTASGRALEFIETYLREQVLPLYANTHTETSHTGMQTTRYREQSRDAIRASVGAGEEDAVIFCGSGATGAIDHLIDMLALRIPRELEDRYGLSAAIAPQDRPVVLVGPYEHHSNEISWRETIAEVVEIGERDDGSIDLEDLERQLKRFAGRSRVIGSFSAASNVTGIKTDTAAITVLLHRYGALSFWDYAAAAPYLPIDFAGTKGSEDPLDYKDAVFISPHKFIGGAGTPGVLVVRRALQVNPVPVVPGGGTVSYVNAGEHRYIDDDEHREEGGTPAIIGSIRAGQVFRLKDAVGTDRIGMEESRLLKRALDVWQQTDNFELMGNPDQPRLSIVSFNIRHGEHYLHHDFVVALLSDLFGIQARGGCSCAGPYGHRLLGIGPERSQEFELAVSTGCNVIKPGWVRLGFNYFISDTVADYIIDAVALIAEHGWRMLSRYEFDPDSGAWRNGDWLRDSRDIDALVFHEGMVLLPPALPTADEGILAKQLEDARVTLESANQVEVDEVRLPPAIESLRWFALPGEDRADGMSD